MKLTDPIFDNPNGLWFPLDTIRRIIIVMTLGFGINIVGVFRELRKAVDDMFTGLKGKSSIGSFGVEGKMPCAP